MSLNFKDLIKEILPNGKLFSVKPGGNLDNVISGISDYIDLDLMPVIEGVRHARNPLLTSQLDSLERDHGLINDTNLTDDERREFLNVFAFNKTGNGDRLFLQTRLRNAGFETVNVIENSPPIDPNVFLASGYSLYCGDDNAYCGDQNAVIGAFPGGELLIDGINIYDLPTDERLNFVFFVGGSATGWILINDWDMEFPDLLYWTANVDTLLSKDLSISNSGIRSLKVEDASNTQEQEPFTLLADPSLVSAYRLFDLDLALNRPFSSQIVQLVSDYDMESVDESSWSVAGACTLAKSTLFYKRGTQSIGVNVDTPYSDYFYQDVLIVGRTYVVNLFYKSNSLADCVLMNGTNIIESRTVSSTDWNTLSFEFTAVDTELGFSISSDSLAYFDNIICFEKPSYSILLNGDFELGNTAWVEYGSPSYDIVSTDGALDSVCGDSFCRLNDGDASKGLYQTRLNIGRTYLVTGFAYVGQGDGTAGDAVIKNGFTNEIYRSSTDADFPGYNEWYELNFEFYATESEFFICNDIGDIGLLSSRFDRLEIHEVYDHSIQNIAPRQLIDDGTCEASGTTSWTAVNSATLTKETSIAYGDQCLQVAYNGVDDATARQSVKLLQGRKYKISGYGQGSSVSGFDIIVDGKTNSYRLTSVYNFDFTFICEDSNNTTIDFVCKTNSAGGWAKFDHIYFVEYDGEFPLRSDKMNHISDGYCDDPNTNSWSSTNANLLKDSLNKISGNFGLAAYRVTPATVYKAISQGCCVVGKKYRLTGYVNQSSWASPFTVRDASTVYWTSTTDSGWQNFDIVFTAAYEDIWFSGASASEFFFIDQVLLSEIPPENYLCEMNIDNIGRSLFSQYPNFVHGRTDMTGLDDDFSISVDVKIPSYDVGMFTMFGVEDEFYISRNGITTTGDSINVVSGLANGNQVEVEYPISDDEWHNIVVNFKSINDPSTVVYVDGVEAGGGNFVSDNPSFSNRLFFGQNENSIDVPPSSITGDANGYIQNVFIYNRSKSEEEIQQIYRNFLDVFWGGSDLRLQFSGLENVTEYIGVDNKVLNSEVHLLPENISGNDWTSLDVDGKLFTYIGINDWRTTSESTVTIYVLGDLGYSVFVDWGDGNNEYIDFETSGDNVYSSPGYKSIVMTGDTSLVTGIIVEDPYISAALDSFYFLANLSSIDLTSCPIGIGTDVMPWPNGVEIILTNCDLTTAEVDRLLNNIYTAGITGGTLYIDGVNDLRSSSSDTQYAWMISNGWSIYYSVSISDVDTDEIITSTQTNVVMTGSGFLSSQGSGKVEICDSADYSTATIIVEQTSVDSWSVTSIQFDVTVGTLLD